MWKAPRKLQELIKFPKWRSFNIWEEVAKVEGHTVILVPLSIKVDFGRASVPSNVIIPNS